MTWSREQQELLEAYGFDLLAQVEAMLRHVRQYQQALQRFRGTLPPATHEPPMPIMAAHVRALRDALTEFGRCLAEIEESTNTPSGEATPGQQSPVERPLHSDTS